MGGYRVSEPKQVIDPLFPWSEAMFDRSEELDCPGKIEQFVTLDTRISADSQLWLNIIELVTQSGHYNKDYCRIKVNYN